MTVTILQALATLPSGEQGVILDMSELARHLSDNYNSQAERDRNARHALRDQLFRDGGVAYMKNVVADQFTDEKVRELRQKWVPHARFNNALKRVVGELSTLYKTPAKRTVSGVADQVKYKEVLNLIHMDEYALEVNRLYNLHRAVLVGFRVRMNPDGTRVPVMDIATPSVVRAIVHPNDNKFVIGWLIKTSYRSVRGADRPPAWQLWTDHERALLDDQMCVIPGTWKQHGFGVCPWVPVVRHPAQPGFWPGEEGEDLVAAAVSIWFAHVCMLKETKSATTQTIYTGETSQMARGQSADSETPIEAPEGVGVATVDMSMDLAMFRDTSEHVYDGVANNHGIAPAIRKHQGIQSAEAREIIRMPLAEQRAEQEVPFREWERHVSTKVMPAVLRVDMPELCYDPAGWSMDFGDSQTPLTPKERLELFKMAREIGVDNTVAFVMRENPDLSFDQAKEFVLGNVEVELWRNIAMRPLQQISGSLGAETPAGGGHPSADSAPNGSIERVEGDAPDERSKQGSSEGTGSREGARPQVAARGRRGS